MPEETAQCDAAVAYSCGVESVWYVEHRLMETGAASRVSLNQALQKPEHGPNISFLQMKQYLEGTRGLWTAGVKTSLWRLDRQFDNLVCIAHCEGPCSPTGHLIALEKDGRDYVIDDMGKVLRLPGLAGERKQLDALEAKFEMTGTVLLVAKSPMPLPQPHGVLAIGTAAVLTCLLLAVVVRRRLRARYGKTVAPAP